MVVEGPAMRSCCPTSEAQWHVRPCEVNGPTRPEPIFYHDSAGRCVNHQPGELVGCEPERTHDPATDGPVLPPVGHCGVCGFAKVICQGEHGSPRRIGHYDADGLRVPAYETSLLPPGPMVVGLDFGYTASTDELHPTSEPLVFARNLRLVPYRWCCETLPGSTHWWHCKFIQYRSE